MQKMAKKAAIKAARAVTRTLSLVSKKGRKKANKKAKKKGKKKRKSKEAAKIAKAQKRAKMANKKSKKDDEKTRKKALSPEEARKEAAATKKGEESDAKKEKSRQGDEAYVKKLDEQIKSTTDAGRFGMGKLKSLPARLKRKLMKKWFAAKSTVRDRPKNLEEFDQWLDKEDKKLGSQFEVDKIIGELKTIAGIRIKREKDANGNIVNKPKKDANGNIVFKVDPKTGKKVPVMEAEQKYRRNEDGKILYQTEKDNAGRTIYETETIKNPQTGKDETIFRYDKDGERVPVYKIEDQAKRDKNGDVVLERNEDGSIKLDDDGNPIPVMEKQKVVEYEQDSLDQNYKDADSEIAAIKESVSKKTAELKASAKKQFDDLKAAKEEGKLLRKMGKMFGSAAVATAKAPLKAGVAAGKKAVKKITPEGNKKTKSLKVSGAVLGLGVMGGMTAIGTSDNEAEIIAPEENVLPNEEEDKWNE